jgi:hypothetical protein
MTPADDASERGPSRAPSTGDVARITAVPDDVRRNLLITLCYHELALAGRDLAGPGANWCAFATWASRQAGSTIRGEDLRNAVRTRLGTSSVFAERLRDLGEVLREMRIVRDVDSLRTTFLAAVEADAAFQRAATAVAIGNRKVFEEIGHAFAAFLSASTDSRPHSGPEFEGFLLTLREGEPPEGQGLLRDAFRAYQQARSEPDPTARAELLFFANLCIGLHEQTRLQPQIAEALEAAFDADAIRGRVVAKLLPGGWARLRHRVAALFGRRPPLDVILDRLLEETRRQLRRALTSALMTLHLPDGVVIRLGRDLEAGFSPSLRSPTHAPLLDLLQRVDPTPDSVLSSGASDWGDLRERMHLITDLFRCYHDRDPLFQPPFEPAQIEALRAGQLPTGAL